MDYGMDVLGAIIGLAIVLFLWWLLEDNEPWNFKDKENNKESED